MLGHRTLTVEDYRVILKRRWWIIAIPAIIFPIISYGITFLIQPLYVSQTLVLIEQQQVPSDYVRPVITQDLESRLGSMREQILSRSSIQPILEHYNLYGTQKMSMDDRIDTMRKSIDIKPIHSDISRANGLPGFFISFKANDAHTAQQVCGEIVSLFVAQNIRSRAATVDQTTQFLQSQLGDARRNLDDQDAKLAAFQRQYFGKLPGEENNNINILSTLNTQFDAATQALGRMEQDKSYMEAMLAQQSAQSVSPAGTPTVAPQAQEKELESLLAQEADLQLHYTPDYPDVKVVHRKILELRKQMAQTAAPVTSATPSTSSASRGDSDSVQKLRAQLRALDLGIQSKRKEQAQLETQVHLYQDRVQSSPQVEQEFKAITRDHETAQGFYDSLLGKINQSKMATDLEHRQQGEQFKVMDEPNLPDGPTYPRRQVFVMGGLAVGAAFGLLIIALLEYKDTALRSERDVWAFTQLPTLAVIAWSGDVAHVKPSLASRLKRPFSRKPAKNEDQIVDAVG